MIKSLIASALLSTCIGAQSIAPRQASTNNYLGAYNCRVFDNFIDFMRDYDLSKSFSFNGNAEKVYVFGTYDNNYYQFSEISISTLANSGGAYGIRFYFGGDEDTTRTIDYEFYDNLAYDDTDLCNITIYFPQSVYLDNEKSYVFDYFFTQTANEYHTYYTGWYTFSQNQIIGNTWSVMGNVTANNTMYNFLGKGSSIYALFDNDDMTLPPIDLYSGGTWATSRSVYFTSVLIPDNVYAILGNIGTYDFVPNTEQSDLKDLFMTIADTPIKFLTDMLNFELLGMNLGIAILSILTLLIIVVVVKKIV